MWKMLTITDNLKAKLLEDYSSNKLFESDPAFSFSTESITSDFAMSI